MVQRFGMLTAVVTCIATGSAMAQFDQCPNEKGGNCHEATPGIGGCCNEDCCNAVCDVDPVCCIIEWDEVCVNIAQGLGCGGFCGGDALYTNGAGPDYNNGNEMARWAQAEDFTGVDGEIGSVHYGLLDSALQGLGQWDGSIQWSIYEGDPNANNVAGSGDGVNITTVFDQNANGFDFYDVRFDLDNPVSVSAENTYWLALHMGQNFNANSLFWSTQTPNGTATGLESDGSFDGPWNTNGTEHYFELLAGDIPEKCLWDLDDDGNVGTGDLILLLGSWGDPYGTGDLIELLGNWGPCPK